MLKAVRWMIFPALVAAAMSTASQAAIITIDDFTTVTPTITQIGAGSTSSAAIAGGGILGTRTMSVTLSGTTTLTSGSAAAPGSGTAQFGFNGPYSSPDLGVNGVVTESFAATDVTSGGLERPPVHLRVVAGRTR